MSFTRNDLLKIYVPFVCRTDAGKTADVRRSGRDHRSVERWGRNRARRVVDTIETRLVCECCGRAFLREGLDDATALHVSGGIAGAGFEL